MTGTGHGAATRSNVLGGKCCLQPINQQGQLPGPYPSNPLHQPLHVARFGPPLFTQPLLCLKKKKKVLPCERDNESRLDDGCVFIGSNSGESERAEALSLCFVS